MESFSLRSTLPRCEIIQPLTVDNQNSNHKMQTEIETHQASNAEFSSMKSKTMVDPKQNDQDLQSAIKNAAEAATTRPLSGVVEAIEVLSIFLQSEKRDELQLNTFCDACSLVSVLFGCLGLAFKFAEMEYDAKVNDLVEASKEHPTLDDIIDVDVANRSVTTRGSHTRNLRRVRQGLELIRALFEQFLSTDDYSLKDAATTAYTQVCAPFHAWTVRTAVYAGMYTLPTREQLLLKLNETDNTVEKKMRRYISASIPIIEYIDELYISRNITLDW